MSAYKIHLIYKLTKIFRQFVNWPIETSTDNLQIARFDKLTLKYTLHLSELKVLLLSSKYHRKQKYTWRMWKTKTLSVCSFQCNHKVSQYRSIYLDSKQNVILHGIVYTPFFYGNTPKKVSWDTTSLRVNNFYV